MKDGARSPPPGPFALRMVGWNANRCRVMFDGRRGSLLLRVNSFDEGADRAQTFRRHRQRPAQDSAGGEGRAPERCELRDYSERVRRAWKGAENGSSAGDVAADEVRGLEHRVRLPRSGAAVAAAPA